MPKIPNSKVERDKLIRAAILKYPTMKYAEIAKLFGVSPWKVYTLAAKQNIRRPRGKGSEAYEQ